MDVDQMMEQVVKTNCALCRKKFRKREQVCFSGGKLYCPHHAPSDADQFELPYKKSRKR